MTRRSWHTSLFRLVGLAIGAASLAGCGASAAVRAAESGDLAALRRSISDGIKREESDPDEARAIARAVASREIGRKDASASADRVRDVQTCAREVEDALEERAEGSDEIAAVASLILLEQGLASPGDLVPHAEGAERSASVTSVAAAFRAVRARVLTKAEDGAQRRALLADADQDVRVAAAGAALDAASAGDTDALIEAARLDPHPQVRTLAIRALGAIGGERVVLALKDMWAIGDEPKRHVIIAAWAMPPSIDAGGRRELLVAAESNSGTPSLAAAIALARAGGDGSASANGVIARAVATGSTRDRVYAISASPLDAPEVRDAILKAQGDPDQAVALAAMARQIETTGAFKPKDSPTERGAVVAKLLKIARETPDTAGGRSAKSALARGKVRAVLPLLEIDAQSKDQAVRQQAGMSIVALGDLYRAALLAADAEARVRVNVACAILRAPK